MPASTKRLRTTCLRREWPTGHTRSDSARTGRATRMRTLKGRDVNLYRYAANNPIQLKDPSGLLFLVGDPPDPGPVTTPPSGPSPVGDPGGGPGPGGGPDAGGGPPVLPDADGPGGPPANDNKTPDNRGPQGTCDYALAMCRANGRVQCWGQSNGTVDGQAVFFGQRIPRLG
jgi:hypothetical protein